MKIKITGASGYLGKLISNELTKKGHQISGIDRQILYHTSEKLKQEISGTDVIINLAGSPILQRWTKNNKKNIYESRIKTTQNLVQAINELPVELQPKKFISASAIGIYKAGFQHDETSTNFDKGFIGTVVNDWEKPVAGLSENVQKVIFRIGLVLGKRAKTITNLRLPFKFGIGATIGNGKQPFPFIHEKDLVRAFLWAIEEYSDNDIFNLVSPEKITNKIFTKELAKKMHRPTFLFVPGLILKLLFGKASVLLLESPEVISEKIKNKGFEFLFPTIQNVLDDIIRA